MRGSQRQQLGVLFFTDGKLPPDSSICLLVINPDYVKSRNIRGPCAHCYGLLLYNNNERKVTPNSFHVTVFYVIRLSFPKNPPSIEQSPYLCA